MAASCQHTKYMLYVCFLRDFIVKVLISQCIDLDYLSYRAKNHIKCQKKPAVSEVLSFAPQRLLAFCSQDESAVRQKGRASATSRDNSAPLHYSLYAQLMDGLFFSFLLKGHLTSDKLWMQNGFEIG